MCGTPWPPLESPPAVSVLVLILALVIRAFSTSGLGGRSTAAVIAAEDVRPCLSLLEQGERRIVWVPRILLVVLVVLVVAVVQQEH
jgi:hypothetical protein